MLNAVLVRIPAPLAQSKQNNRKFWLKRKVTRAWVTFFCILHLNWGVFRRSFLRNCRKYYPLRFLHRLREIVAASFNAATLLLKPSSSFSMSPNKSTSKPYRCNNKTTFAFINSLLFDNLPRKRSMYATFGREGWEGSAPRPVRRASSLTHLFILSRGYCHLFSHFFKQIS